VEAGLKRGEIWTAAGGPGFVAKPRPFVIVRDERLGLTTSVTVCGFTSDPTDAPIFRVLIRPSRMNRLHAPSRIMIDKVTTIPTARLSYRVGRLDTDDITRLDHALMIHLGLTG
jgi:mRNA interferase MazF